jgi:hypothetical protein
MLPIPGKLLDAERGNCIEAAGGALRLDDHAAPTLAVASR